MLKVGIIGPESTGKSTLAQQLSQRYHGIYVPEYAREYVEQLGHPYTYDDVCTIARHQIEQLQAYASSPKKTNVGKTESGCSAEAAESGCSIETAEGNCSAETTESGYRAEAADDRWKALSQDGIVFFDTELIITRVWFDYCYGSAPDWLLEAMVQHKMDVYLLLYPDLAWVDDPVRENGSEAIRLELFRRYEQEIQSLGVPYYIIRHTSQDTISATKMA